MAVREHLSPCTWDTRREVNDWEMTQLKQHGLKGVGEHTLLPAQAHAVENEIMNYYRRK